MGHGVELQRRWRDYERSGAHKRNNAEFAEVVEVRRVTSAQRREPSVVLRPLPVKGASMLKGSSMVSVLTRSSGGSSVGSVVSPLRVASPDQEQVSPCSRLPSLLPWLSPIQPGSGPLPFPWPRGGGELSQELREPRGPSQLSADETRAPPRFFLAVLDQVVPGVGKLPRPRVVVEIIPLLHDGLFLFSSQLS